ncbi:MAG: hypothetical protein QXQ60_06325 [Thermofilum sp.]
MARPSREIPHPQELFSTAGDTSVGHAFSTSCEQGLLPAGRRRISTGVLEKRFLTLKLHRHLG